MDSAACELIRKLYLHRLTAHTTIINYKFDTRSAAIAREKFPGNVETAKPVSSSFACDPKKKAAC